jgi:hypothetical protein
MERVLVDCRVDKHMVGPVWNRDIGIRSMRGELLGLASRVAAERQADVAVPERALRD